MLRKNRDLERYCSEISLTSISFLSSGSQELYRVAFDRVVEGDQDLFGSVFAEAAAYSKMMLLHKSFTESIYTRPNQPDAAAEEQKVTTAVHLFSPTENSPVKTLPFSGWVVQALVTWNKDGSGMELERVYTHPLEKQEIVRALKGRKCDQDETSVEIFLHETVLTPKSQFAFPLSSFPKTLIIPATGGIAMKVDCMSDDEPLSLAYTCVPKKFTVGQLTCSVMTNFTKDDPEVEPGHRSQRSVEPDQPDYWANIRGDMGKLWTDWKKLVPDIFSCSASVAGCDMCFYFLGTYNYSVVPAACLGGCTINTVDSCTGVVMNSLLNTVKKLTGDKD